MACQLFLATLPAEHNLKDLYNNTELRERLLIKKVKMTILKSKKKSKKKGMKKLRATRSKEEIAEQRKVWNKTYLIKCVKISKKNSKSSKRIYNKNESKSFQAFNNC